MEETAIFRAVMHHASCVDGGGGGGLSLGRTLKPYPESSGRAVVAGVLQYALGDEREAAVLVQTPGRVVHLQQVLHQVRPRGARGPAHRLLQDADTARREVLHRRL